MEIFVVVWFGLGWIFAVLTYGGMFAYFQRKYKIIADGHFYADRTFAVFASLVALVCPVTFTVTLGTTDFFKHGFMFQWSKK